MDHVCSPFNIIFLTLLITYFVVYLRKLLTMKMYFLYACLLCTTTIFSQLAVSFDEAGALHLRGPHMDSIYQSGLNVDSTKAVFGENEEAYIESYQNMLQEFGKYLKQNNFFWDEPTHGFNRIYFNEQGKVDYFLYSFRTEIPEEKQEQFETLLNQFIKTYQFPMQAKCKFAQCSPVTYMPSEEEK